MLKKRAGGILLHPTSLPSLYGVGDLGRGAYRFLDFLSQAGLEMWQVLPLGPTGYGASPYASLSTYAGNPLLIALDMLEKKDLLSAQDLADIPDFPVQRVDFNRVEQWKYPLLVKGAKRFLDNIKSGVEKKAFEKFCALNQAWLNDFALFMVIKQVYDRKALQEGVDNSIWYLYWDKDIALRKATALEKWITQYYHEIEIQKVLQFFFFSQWQKLRKAANEQNILLIGDIPIFVAQDSVDVWANRELFHVDKKGKPTKVSGVPPDYFSPTGQLWGNPLYKWDVMEKSNFSWWIKRFEHTLDMVDIVRIDHFRGFQACWEIAADEATAVNGKWVKAPGEKLFQAICIKLDRHNEKTGKAENNTISLPFIAEDLGVITPEVDQLRDYFNLPGMKVLQFAFDLKEAGGLNPNNNYLPHNHEYNCVVYTGTHDNNTTKGWYDERSEQERDLVRRYFARSDDDIVWDFMRAAFSSVAKYAIIPMQDLLVLGAEERMNTPSTTYGNWSWRLIENSLTSDKIDRLREMLELYGRCNND